MEILHRIIRRLLPLRLRGWYNAYIITPSILQKRYPKSMFVSPLNLNPDYIEMDEYSRLQNKVSVISSGGCVRIGKYSAVGSGTCFIPGTHTPTVGLPQYLSVLHLNDVTSVIEVEEDCWIGAQTILLMKAKVGRGCVIGARSLVTKEIPPYAIATGSPAKIVGVRFSLEQILKHEEILYPAEKRMTKSQLTELFEGPYKGLKVLGTDKLNEQESLLLRQKLDKMGCLFNNNI